MITRILKRTESWGGPDGWWASLGLDMHPALYLVGVVQLSLVPVLILAGWVLLLITVGPATATRWAWGYLAAIPGMVRDLGGKRR